MVGIFYRELVIDVPEKYAEYYEKVKKMVVELAKTFPREVRSVADVERIIQSEVSPVHYELLLKAVAGWYECYFGGSVETKNPEKVREQVIKDLEPTLRKLANLPDKGSGWKLTEVVQIPPYYEDDHLLIPEKLRRKKE